LKYSLLPWFAVFSLFPFAGIVAVSQSQPGNSLTTAERLEAPGWWPTKGNADRRLFLGNDECAMCHKSIAATQEATAMFQAGTPASRSRILEAHPALNFREGDFTTDIRSTPEEVLYSVSDGAQSTKLTATWALGSPQKGQTYILNQGDDYYESRVSYFVKLDGLDITVGHAPSVPEDMKTAVGRKLQAREVRLCFGCHTTASMTLGIVSPDKALPGVTCEACHGPGAKHVESMEASDVKGTGGRKAIFNPGILSPSEQVDFCGACHKTWADVLETPSVQGAIEIRYQPYRLEQSRCWGKNGDPRITCVACHNPHKPLLHDPEAYDSKCLACHSKRLASTAMSSPRSVCKIATGKCVTCHMPQYSIPQIHGVFTDHEIRIVQPRSMNPRRPSELAFRAWPSSVRSSIHKISPLSLKAIGSPHGTRTENRDQRIPQDAADPLPHSVRPVSFRCAGPGVGAEGNCRQARAIEERGGRIGLPGVANLCGVGHGG
jgi:hypothetical protein